MALIQYDDMRREFQRILKKRGFTDADAATAAAVFADNSLDGVYSHGYIRFPRMVDYLDKGVIDLRWKPPVKWPSARWSAGTVIGASAR